MKFVSGTNLERFADKFKEWVSNLFQPKLTSGTNIKTINNTSLLGSGDIDTSEVFMITFTNSNDTWSVDCTAAQLTNAVASGKQLMGKYTTSGALGGTSYYTLQHDMSGMINTWVFHCKAPNSAPNTFSINNMMGTLGVTAPYDVWYWSIVFDYDSSTDTWSCDKTWTDISMQMMTSVYTGDGTNIVGRYGESYYYADNIQLMDNTLTMSCDNPVAGDPYKFTVSAAVPNTDPPIITPDFHGKMSNPMTTAGDIIYSSDNTGTPARLAKGTTGNLLRAGTNGPEYSDALPYLTTAPSADNTDGIKIVVLSSQPSNLYNGYLYLIQGS